MEDIIGLPAMDAPEISAKMGINIEEVLEDVVKNVPAPTGDMNAPLKALIFDSQYDSYRGVIVYMRIMEMCIRDRSVGSLELLEEIQRVAAARDVVQDILLEVNIEIGRAHV